jgi:hypothetical protein
MRPAAIWGSCGTLKEQFFLKVLLEVGDLLMVVSDAFRNVVRGSVWKFEYSCSLEAAV